MSPLSQCLPTTRASTGAASEVAAGERARVVGVVEGGAHVVAHAAVDRDVDARGSAVEVDRLDGADLVEREGARPGDRPARLDRDARHGDAVGSALPLDDLGHAGREALAAAAGRARSCRRCRSRRRGRARAARRRARSRSACAGRGCGGPTPRSRPCRRSASRCGCAARAAAARRAARGCGAPPRRRARPTSERPNFWSSWAVAMNSWVCASTPTVTRISTGADDAELARDGGDALDLVEGVDDDAAHAVLERPRGSRRRSCCCRAGRCARPARRRACATASSPPEQTSRCSPSSSIQRATSVQRNALPA